jgi:hypothetical protein
MTALPPITAPTPIYEAMITLATVTERRIILAAGPREWLGTYRRFPGNLHHAATIAAYEAMASILTRVTSGTELCVTGIDPRAIPPRREPLDPSLLLHGGLEWIGPEGRMSKLVIGYIQPPLHITDLRIEPTTRASAPALPEMSRSTRLKQGERIDDTARLAFMQRFIDQGDTPNGAARKAAEAEPYPHSTEGSTVKRLTRKFKDRARQ